jgi:hypothetical protein
VTHITNTSVTAPSTKHPWQQFGASPTLIVAQYLQSDHSQAAGSGIKIRIGRQTKTGQHTCCSRIVTDTLWRHCFYLSDPRLQLQRFGFHQRHVVFEVPMFLFELLVNNNFLNFCISSLLLVVYDRYSVRNDGVRFAIFETILAENEVDKYSKRRKLPLSITYSGDQR